MQVGIVGFGNVGRQVAATLESGAIPGVHLACVTHTDLIAAAEAAKDVCPGALVLSIDELIDSSDLIVETATAASFPDIAQRVIVAGKTLIAVSAAGVLELPQLYELAAKHRAKVIFASGMLPGLDLIRSAREGDITRVTLTTTLRPDSLLQEPYIVDRQMKLPTTPGEVVEV